MIGTVRRTGSLGAHGKQSRLARLALSLLRAFSDRQGKLFAETKSLPRVAHNGR